MLGEIALWSFVILLLTGTFLSLFFVPSMNDVVYHGSYIKLDGVKMSEAYQSTLNISFDVRGGLLMRQIHHWAADLFMAALIAHMLRVFFTGAYRKPREINWLIGIGLFRWDYSRAYSATRCPMTSYPAPACGSSRACCKESRLSARTWGSSCSAARSPGASSSRGCTFLHVLLIPGLLLGLITAHLFIMFHQKHTQMPAKGNTEKNVVGQPFFPYFLAKGGAWFFFIFAGLVLLATSPRSTRSGYTGRIRRWPSRPPPSPTSTWACWKARCASCRPGRSISSAIP